MADPVGTQAAVAAAVLATLRYTAEAGHNAAHDAAENLARLLGVDGERTVQEQATCPVCQATTCDEGCPLAQIRAGQLDRPGVVVVLFGSGADGWCNLTRCPLGSARWFPDKEAATPYLDSLPETFEPHVLRVDRGPAST